MIVISSLVSSRIQQLQSNARQLPDPDPLAQEHSKKLISLIKEEIDDAGGAIPFAEYMDLALYAPALGYYSAGMQKFGAKGDFVTAPEISPVFSQCLARQCQQVLQSLGDTASLLEVGAGSGKMALEILKELDRLASLPEKYYILELSADLRQRQYETLHQEVPQLLSRVQWLQQLPASFEGVIVANELLDAMPVHRVSIDEAGIPQELYVQWTEGGFTRRFNKVLNNVLYTRVESLKQYFSPGYVSEVNLAMEAWVRSIGSMLKRGVLLIVDYGFTEKEYYHPQRSEGTLMCHYRHRAHDDPLVFPGLQDITAHVDYTALANSAIETGLQVSGYNTQCYFLMAAGLSDIMSKSDATDSAAHLKLSQEVKILTMPGEMGELFKVMALSKDLDYPLLGFGMQDLRGSL